MGRGRFSYVSASCRALLGYTPEELVGTDPMALVHEDDKSAFLDALRGARTGQPIRTPPHRLRHRSGKWVWVEATGVVYQNETGDRATIGVARDITAAILAAQERREFEKHMARTQKLESLGVMAGGLAHDFNNLLTPILGNANLALADEPKNSAARSRLEKIERAAHRAASLARQLLAYAGKGTFQFENMDLSRAVADMGDLLETAGTRDVSIDYRLEADLPPIEGDPAQLNQVIMNLITNAAEASGEAGGRIRVGTGALVADRQLLDAANLGAGLPEGEYVYLLVEDDGCGMDDETLEHLFDPFFTTKFTGRGLGLAAVQGIVRSHGGAIQIRSAPGCGSSFQILLPAAERPAASLETGAAGTSAWRMRGTVLLVDDDEGVRDLAAEVLARSGLEVLEACDGLAGVDLFRRHASEVVCCLIDGTMPGKSGDKVSAEIRDIRADVPILIVSGYAEERLAEGLGGEGLVGFLQKPFLPEALVEEVRRLVDQRE